MITEISKKTVSRNILHFYSKATLLSNSGTFLIITRIPKDAVRLFSHVSICPQRGTPWSMVNGPFDDVPQSGL